MAAAAATAKLSRARAHYSMNKLCHAWLRTPRPRTLCKHRPKRVLQHWASIRLAIDAVDIDIEDIDAECMGSSPTIVRSNQGLK